MNTKIMLKYLKCISNAGDGVEGVDQSRCVQPSLGGDMLLCCPLTTYKIKWLDPPLLSIFNLTEAIKVIYWGKNVFYGELTILKRL